MLRAEHGSYDGARVMLYAKDAEFLVGEGFMPYHLAEVFLEIGAAEVAKGTEKTAGPLPTQTELSRLERAEEAGRAIIAAEKGATPESNKATESKFFGLETALETEGDEASGEKPDKAKKSVKSSTMPKEKAAKESGLSGLFHFKDEGE
jgi:hypothetical protein